MEFTSKNTASTGVVVAPAEVDVATSPAFERDIADAFVTGSGSVVVNFARWLVSFAAWRPRSFMIVRENPYTCRDFFGAVDDAGRGGAAGRSAR
jgi:hypothetical protein